MGMAKSKTLEVVDSEAEWEWEGEGMWIGRGEQRGDSSSVWASLR